MTNSTVPRLAYVVDDVEGNRLLAQAYLEHLGWSVRVFSDGQSAFDSLKTEVPEAMLIDIRMPGISGDLLAAMVRTEPDMIGIRLVGYTAHALADEVSTLRASGFDDVLIKPVLMADMARAFPRARGDGVRTGRPS